MATALLCTVHIRFDAIWVEVILWHAVAGEVTEHNIP
jgi:hypothetical protein